MTLCLNRVASSTSVEGVESPLQECIAGFHLSGVKLSEHRLQRRRMHGLGQVQAEARALLCRLCSSVPQPVTATSRAVAWSGFARRRVAPWHSPTTSLPFARSLTAAQGACVPQARAWFAEVTSSSNRHGQ